MNSLTPTDPPPSIVRRESRRESRRGSLRSRRRAIWVALATIALPLFLIGGILLWLMSWVTVVPADKRPGFKASANETFTNVTEPEPRESSTADALPSPPTPEPILRSRTLAGTPPPSVRPRSNANTVRPEGPPAHHVVFESPLPIHGHNSIDDFVFTALFKEGLHPAKGCSDAVFLRRAYLDATGCLPTVDQAEAFFNDVGERKRERLIDELLQRDEYADYWAMKWCDVLRVKAEFPINLWPGAAHAYHRWIRTAVANDMPYDDFARELLTASGSNFRRPQVNFYRAIQSKEPEAIAKTVALTFMATRAEKWPTAKLDAMAKFFTKVGYKPTGEWKEEIIFFDRYGNQTDGAETGDSAKVSTTIRTAYPSGARVVIPPDQDPREAFAAWMTHPKNPWFTRAVANRVWYWLMGRGIVNPVDDVSTDNPASNLELLNHLGEVLAEEDFSIKELIRRIMKSSVYQLSCIPPSADPRAVELFAHHDIRRHDAEVLIDAINQITKTTETYMSIVPEPFTWLPETQRAVAIPDGSITSSFLELFGRPSRDTGLASERDNRLTARQALHLLNSNHIRNKLKNGDGLQELQENTINSTQLAEQVYLAVLSRLPSEEELIRANMLCSDSVGTRELAWGLINSDEFLFQH